MLISLTDDHTHNEVILNVLHVVKITRAKYTGASTVIETTKGQVFVTEPPGRIYEQIKQALEL